VADRLKSSGRNHGLAVTAVLFSLLIVCSCVASQTGSGEAVRALETPARPGSAQPNLAAGADGRLYLSWIEPDDSARYALRFAVWNDTAWSSPRTIATGDDWFVNWADFPAMAALEDGSLAAHWLVKSGGSTYAYDVVVSVSRDGGASWSEPVHPHSDGTLTEHGFVSLVPTPEGRFLVVWLDGRKTVGDDPGPMTLRSAWLGPDGRVSDEALVDDSVCDCCPTDAVRAEDGSVVVAYRDRSSAEVRDVFVSRLEEGQWSTLGAVHVDGWKIGGCPVNGPALAIRGDRMGCAWYTMGGEEPASVRVAFSDDGGLSFAPPVEVDSGDPIGRVDLTFHEDGSALVSWIEQRGDTASILVRRLSQTTEPGAVRVATATSVSRSSGFPRMVRHGGQTFLAWTAAGEPTQVRTGVLP
jgi:hypothetical protein